VDCHESYLGRSLGAVLDSRIFAFSMRLACFFLCRRLPLPTLACAALL
jgi:hypothetical protein